MVERVKEVGRSQSQWSLEGCMHQLSLCNKPLLLSVSWVNSNCWFAHTSKILAKFREDGSSLSHTLLTGMAEVGLETLKRFPLMLVAKLRQMEGPGAVWASFFPFTVSQTPRPPLSLHMDVLCTKALNFFCGWLYMVRSPLKPRSGTGATSFLSYFIDQKSHKDSPDSSIRKIDTTYW